MDAVFATMGLMRTEMRRRHQGEVSMSQFPILRTLAKQPGVSLGELAERLGLRPPTVSRLVDDLVARGWVQRTQSTSDRRSVALSLTEAGDEMMREGRRAGLLKLAERLSALDDDEAARLVAAAGSLRRAVVGVENERGE
ncbi:MAG: MarR family transcriptional regulator [Armatimonadetes bacterium]|nr:MarR family transcriptional regulator [Armatimonadota bacterium]